MFVLNIASIVIAILILIFAAVQFWLVHTYCLALRKAWLQHRHPDQNEYLPAAAVILCLRGSDPSLLRCLSGLAQQEYPDFRLYAVADNENDPAIEAFDLAKSEFAHQPTLIILQDISRQRTLKCSALLAAFEKISEDEFEAEVIALLDSDVECDPYWLNDLVQPLAQPDVGASTGNRWFQPKESTIGSWLRSVWNAASVVQMYHYNIAWGGSLAFKSSLTADERFLAGLKTGFCEDTGMSEVLAAMDLKLARVPGLIMGSNETTTINRCKSFITRQLLTARLYHPAWPLVVSHGLLIAIFNIAAILIFILSLALGFQLQHGLPLIALVVFQLGNLYLLNRIFKVNSIWLRERGQVVESEPVIATYFASVFLIQFVHPIAILAARFKKTFAWRQIEYRVEDGSNVKLLEYQPFQSNENQHADAQSIE